MTNIEKCALAICRMPNSDKVMEALTVLLPMMRRERDGGEAPRPTPPAALCIEAPVDEATGGEV